MVWDAIASAAGSITQGLYRNKKGRDEAKRQMDFQRDMSSTAHQREVADLRAAGLNPILSGTGGAGASTPGGSMAPMESTASDSREAFKMGKLIDEQLKNLEKDTDKKSQEERTSAGLERLQKTQRIREANAARLIMHQTMTEKERTRSGALDNSLKQIDVDFFTNAEAAKVAKTLGVKPETVQNVFKLLRGMK